MKQNRINVWKCRLLFVFALLSVCLCGTGCCLRNAWSIGERTVTLDDRYFEYSEDGSEFIYTCRKKDVLLLPFYIAHFCFGAMSGGHSPI